MRFQLSSWTSLILLALFAAFDALPASAQIQVNSTAPSAAPQGTVNLDVTINGNGFKKGATAKWFVTGTTNPGGVTVNSTTYRSSSQLIANITVADSAIIGGFDVLVYSSGRTGKGTDLFAVSSKGTPVGCSTAGTPGGFTLITELNPVQPNGAALITTGRLGNAIRVRPLDLDRNGVVDTLVTLVTSASGATYVYLLDPVNGRMQVTNPVTGAVWQNPMLVLTGVPGLIAEAGDVNADGVPDFVLAYAGSAAYLLVGSVTPGSYTLSYAAFQIPHPTSAPGYWAIGLAMGELDGDGVDEIAIGARPANGEKTLPGVYLYKFTGGAPTFTRKIEDPSGTLSTLFGEAIAIGNIDGNPSNELVVGAMAANNNNGIVYVFPYPATQSSYFSLSGPGPNFGQQVDVADVTGDTLPDLAIFSSKQGFFYTGTVRPGNSYSSQLLPAPGLDALWAKRDGDVGQMLTNGVIAVGAPNASTDHSCVVGAVHLYAAPFAASQFPNYLFQPPDLVGSSQFEYGYGIGLAPGYPFLIIGEHLRAVGTTLSAGQVYVYKY